MKPTRAIKVRVLAGVDQIESSCPEKDRQTQPDWQEFERTTDGNPGSRRSNAQSKTDEMLLEVDGTQLHGSVVELMGRTEPNAALIINGEAVADIQRDGHFRYFTQPLSRGSHEIVVTGQNRRGGTAIKRVPIVIP